MSAQAGSTCTAYDVPVERGKILEFARAVLSENPAHFQEVPIAPPTLLSSEHFWEPRDRPMAARLGFDPRHILHGAVEYVFHGRPPRAGDKLTATSRIDAVFQKEGRRGGRLRIAVIVRVFRNRRGELVAEVRDTLIETSRPPDEIP